MSRGAAVSVMAMMAGLLAIASLVPGGDTDSGHLAEVAARHPVLQRLARGLRVSELVGSPAFFALPAFLFAGISLSIVQRVRQYRARGAKGMTPGATRFRVERDFLLESAPEGEMAGRLGSVLRGARWDVWTSGPAAIEAERGRTGFAERPEPVPPSQLERPQVARPGVVGGDVAHRPAPLEHGGVVGVPLGFQVASGHG